MRRMLAGAKKALRRNKVQDDPPHTRDTQAQIGQSESDQALFKFSIGPAPPGGYTCWDNAQCGLCSRFLDRWFILEMFTSKFVVLGKIINLLKSSQASGRCVLWNYICLGFVKEMAGEEIDLDASVSVRWDTKDTATKGDRKDEVSSFSFELAWGSPRRRVKSVHMNCFTYEDQKMGHYITTRPPNPDISSPQAFSKAKTWLSECVNSHTQCQRVFPSGSKMPTRVLQVSMNVNDSYSIRLRKPTGEAAPYVALSYIWGGPQSCCTLKSNIDERMQQIDATKLPNTIMDAVRCTQKLGLRYLWVDSLCIIQDSPEDMAKEIGRMSGIYNNAYVTISAAKATSYTDTPEDPAALNEWIEKYRTKDDLSNLMSGTELEDIFKMSCWNRSDAWYYTPSTVWLAGTPLSGSEQSDLLTAGDIKDEPISKRGWTLQESWLSPRMLIYGFGQLLWECRTGIQVDGGVIGTMTGRDARSLYKIDEKGEIVFNDGSEVSDGVKEYIFGSMWRNIVFESSRRALTDPGDKLNALEGIVQELRWQTGDEYLAGLWRQRLYKTPLSSWSWIKTDGPVSFSPGENSSAVVENANVTRNEIEGEYPHSRLVVEGSITLRAPMSTLSVAQSIPNFNFPSPDSSSRVFTHVILLDGASTNPIFTTQIIDGESNVLVPPGVRFLELSWGKQGGLQNIANESRGLVLVPVNTERSKDLFQRVGFFVVALEEDPEQKNAVSILSYEPEKVEPTDFGKIWKESLKEEVVTII